MRLVEALGGDVRMGAIRFMLEKDLDVFEEVAREAPDLNTRSEVRRFIDAYTDSLDFMDNGTWDELDSRLMLIPPPFSSSVEEYIERNRDDRPLLVQQFCETKVSPFRRDEETYYGLPLGTIMLSYHFLMGEGFEFETPLHTLNTTIIRAHEEGRYWISSMRC